MAVSASLLVRLGPPQRVRVRQLARDSALRLGPLPQLEDQILGPQASLPDLTLDPFKQVVGDAKLPPLFALRVVLHQETPPSG